LLKDLASGGFAAVAFFFVLSGFILSYAHAGPSEHDGCDVKASVFWRLRFGRIAPAYYLGLLLSIPFVAYHLDVLAVTGWSRFVGPVLVILFLQAWWPRFALLWNFPAWSLSVECLFYAVFPCLARALARVPRTTLFAITYALIVAATAYRSGFLSSPSFVLQEELPNLRFQAYFPLLHLPLFIFGMALGRLFLFGPTISTRMHAAMLWAGICLLLLLFGGTRLFPWWTRSEAVLVLVFALIIFGGAGAGAARLLGRPGFVLLGEASYVMYILHIPLRFWWDTGQDMVGFRFQPWLSFLLYFVLVVVVSVVVYRHFEMPLRRWINKQEFSFPRRSAISFHREA
jgi:peptidoglycan/LPS O-acetylase OafA/YrhL